MRYLFGKSEEEILNLIEADERKIKMTREEAMNKVEEACGLPLRNIVYAIEALGLIKFEEKKNFVNVNVGGSKITIDVEEAAKALRHAGYSVTKLDGPSLL